MEYDIVYKLMKYHYQLLYMTGIWFGILRGISAIALFTNVGKIKFN